METKNIIRTIYLYVATLIGLIMIVIGAYGFIDMGLKAYIFTEAEAYEKANYAQPIPYELSRIEKATKSDQFSAEEIKIMKEWLAKYEEKQEVDYVKSRRHREAAGNLGLLLVGLPLYLYHWGIVRRKKKA